MSHECIAICLVYCHVLSSVQRMPCSDHILHPWPGNTVAMELLYDGIYGNKNVENILDMNWNNTRVSQKIFKPNHICLHFKGRFISLIENLPQDIDLLSI